MDLQFLSDEELIAQYLKQNDEAALEILVKRYVPRVYSLARQYTGDADNASDIAQETFVKVWKNLKRFDTTRSFRSWIFTIAKNTAFDWLKRKRPIPFSLLDNFENAGGVIQTVADTTPTPAETFDDRELVKSANRAVQNLPPMYRTVVVLRHNHDLTFDEIAERLEISINTVKSRHRRALKLLQKALRENYGNV